MRIPAALAIAGDRLTDFRPGRRGDRPRLTSDVERQRRLERACQRSKISVAPILIEESESLLD
jgi:hypothetical protein